MFTKKDEDVTKAVCPRCTRILGPDDKVCDCGAASPLMSFDERRRFEVEQWRSHARHEVAS